MGMKERYIGMFKIVFVILSILLVVVCFLLGDSYSNFVYSSNDHRAVEMLVGDLKYKIKINNKEENSIKINPGINVLSIEIESLNEIDTYFKLLTSNNELNYFYLDNESFGIIKSNDKYYINLLVSNNKEEIVDCRFIVGSGFINNTIDDVIIPEGYSDINNKLYVLDSVKFNSYDFKVLDINNDGTVNIILSNPYNTNTKLTGLNGYQNSNSIINTLCNELFESYKIIENRNVRIEDIEKYTNNTIVTKVYKDYSRETPFYVPNNDNMVNNIGINETVINNINGSKYNDVFLNKKYITSNTYAHIDSELNWGVLSVNNGSVEFTKLYDLNGNEYSEDIYILPIIKLSNMINIKYESGNIIIE